MQGNTIQNEKKKPTYLIRVDDVVQQQATTTRKRQTTKQNTKRN